ncbi:MAG: hypothetical protein ACFFG0_09705 [Candidatus Thorarchaeota archaeon]
MSKLTEPLSNKWLLGSKSYLELKTKPAYLIGREPAPFQRTFLDSTIKFPLLVKYMIPRLYEALTRREHRQRQRYFYDPLVTVRNDHVSFLMKDNNSFQPGYWELNFTEDVFTEMNLQRGRIFVDFNNDFIQSIQSLKSSSESQLTIDHTGLKYKDDENTTHLPNCYDDRKTLIKLLKVIESEFQAEPDQFFELDTALAWDQTITKENLQPSQAKTDFPSLYDYKKSDWEMNKGEVSNPFNWLRLLTRTLFEKSRIARYFYKKYTVKHFEDTNEYIFSIPLIEPLKFNSKFTQEPKFLGGFQIKLNGRVSRGTYEINSDFHSGRRRW